MKAQVVAHRREVGRETPKGKLPDRLAAGREALQTRASQWNGQWTGGWTNGAARRVAIELHLPLWLRRQGRAKLAALTPNKSHLLVDDEASPAGLI